MNVFASKLITMPRSVKRALVFGIDLGFCLLSVPIAFYLRLGVIPPLSPGLLIATITAVLLAMPIFVIMGLYRSIFRYASWSTLSAIAISILVYSMPYFSIFTAIGVSAVPRTIGIIQPLILFVLIGSGRSFVRLMLAGDIAFKTGSSNQQRILIYGAGAAGRQLCAGLSHSSNHVVVGFLDDDPRLIGSTLYGKSIYGPADLDQLYVDLNVTDILVALPSAGRGRRAEIINRLRQTPLHVRILPGVSELATGKVTTSDLREPEIEDILGRETVPPDQLLLARNILNKTLMVTGAGGSIGSELCRQIWHAGPDRLFLVDNSEYNLYAIHQELQQHARNHGVAGPELVPIIASVCDRRRMEHVISTARPDTIFHAAAYKHVPLVEANPLEGIRNNVLGTFVVATLAEEYDVANLVLVSTDKAVRPTNVMGATKRLAEQILQAKAEVSSTRMSMVRFGNVLGSSGSVVPLFQRQIRDGGPVTLTHTDIIRFFMTIPEAAQLVIQAGAMARGGDVFVLDMGEPIRIADLARNMIELSGLSVKSEANPDGDIEIVTVGLRPGEKLYEELLIGNNPEETAHPRIMRAREHFVGWTDLVPKLEDLFSLSDEGDTEAAIDLVRQLVPEYSTETATMGRAAIVR